ncbi:MAG: ATP-binding protein [Nitrosomonas sp.]|nr:ATP-binding protein [Nitrosomonas sp.]
MSESLPLMLKELRLPAFGQHYRHFQDQAAEHAWGYSQYLAALCEQEVAQRFQSRISNWTHEAKLPRGKSFATLTLTELPQAAQKKSSHCATIPTGRARQTMCC